MSVISLCSPLARTVAIATLMGSTFLAGPLTPARAAPVGHAPLLLTQSVSAKPAATRGETVEQRITNLHAALKITTKEESKWNNVAQAMRENASAMDKLVAEKRTQAPQSMTALDDLKTYQDFAQAHVDSLKNLTSAFTTLYDAMSDAQKKNADQVFRNYRRDKALSKG